MALEQFEHTLTQLQENCSSLVMLFDRQSLEIVHLNATARRRLGLATDAPCPGLITEIFPEISVASLEQLEAAPAPRRSMLHAAAGDCPVILEILGSGDNGDNERNTDQNLVMVMALETTSGTIQPNEGNTTDIAYRSLVANSPYCIHQIDLDGKLSSMNQAGLNMINETDEQCIIGVPYIASVCEADKPRIQQLLDSALKGTASEFEFTSPDGKEFSSNFVPIKDEVGCVEKLLGITIDITERKQQERELKDNQALLIATGRVAKVGGWQLNAHTSELSWTDQTYAIHELPIGQQPRLEDAISFYHPEDRPAVEAAVSASLETGEPFEFELRIITAKGNLRWVHSRGEPEFVNGELSRITGIFQDITERKISEAQLQKIEKLESIGLLAGGIAHDFNNILTTLFGNIDLLKRTIDADSDSLPLIEKSEMALQRATNLTRRLLTFSRGGAPVKDGSSIVDLIKEVVKFDLSGSNVLPIFNKSEDLWLTSYDVGQMEQVFSNLTLNAARAMPGGGHIYISLENCPQSEQPISLPSNTGCIRITFRDEGCGIEQHDLSNIFDPYFTTKEDGQGLGLATTLSIISRHGGYISAASEPGVGTTFVIYLPVAEKSVATKEVDVNTGATRREGPARILVMDDDEMVREITAKILKHGGHEVDLVEDGDEAIASYRNSLEKQEPYDCVIMDLTIPGGMGGKEALKNILALDADARAIVSSGYAADAIMSEYASYGFKGCVAKPFSMEQLNETVERVISQ